MSHKETPSSYIGKLFLLKARYSKWTDEELVENERMVQEERTAWNSDKRKELRKYMSDEYLDETIAPSTRWVPDPPKPQTYQTLYWFKLS